MKYLSVNIHAVIKRIKNDSKQNSLLRWSNFWTLSIS